MNCRWVSDKLNLSLVTTVESADKHTMQNPLDTLGDIAKSDDRRAVSPVIGVILMVAITVILAAVIATFVLGLGEQVSDTTPNANFNADFEPDNSSDFFVTIQHQSGDRIDVGELSVAFPDNASIASQELSNAGLGDEISAGDAFTIGNGSSSLNISPTQIGADDRIQIIYDTGDTSSILRTFEAPRDYNVTAP